VSHRAPALLVFAKDPVPGSVKSRLGPILSAAGAARVAAELVQAALVTAVAARAEGIVDSVTLCCTPTTSAFFGECAARFDVALDVQRGNDLGARMQNALNDALAQGRSALLMGSDCPALNGHYLAAGANALATHDVVIGPAEDGGYVLIGLARMLDCFSAIAWSSASVLAETRQRLAELGASWAELPTLWDVDTPADLARWKALPA